MLFYFKKEDNDFSEILEDPSIKPQIRVKIKLYQHLILSLYQDTDTKLQSYIILKFGELLTKMTEKDYTPIPNVDYRPKKPVTK
jgi:hypothetical protein